MVKGKEQLVKTLNKTFILVLVLISVFLSGFSGCTPEGSDPEDPKYEAIVTLEKTPLQIVDWTDSLWIHYTDRSWESYVFSTKNKKSFVFASEVNETFSASYYRDNQLWLGSTFGTYLIFNLGEKNLNKTNFLNILFTGSYTNTFFRNTDNFFMTMEDKAYKWNGTQFEKLSIPAKYKVRDFAQIGNFYFWSHLLEGSQEVNYILSSNSSTFNDGSIDNSY